MQHTKNISSTPSLFFFTKRHALLLLLQLLFITTISARTALPSLPTADSTGFELQHPDVSDLFFKDDSLSCTIPFNKSGSLILIQAKADSMDGNFILDTGAPCLVLNMIYFRDYPIQAIADEQQTTLSGTADLAHKTTINQFTLGALEYYRQEADLIDLGHLENSRGIKILGLIGLSLLQQCEVVIDYNKSLIYLHRLGKKDRKTYQSPHLADGLHHSTIPFDILEGKLVAQTEMKGKKLNFIVDSGAESNILDSRLSEKIFESVDITGRMNIRGTGSSVIEAVKGDLKGLKIGGEAIEHLPVLITNLKQTCFSLHSCVNGVLGLEFLPLQKIGFNFVTRKMYLWK